jgi:L-aminopeptidase/D-esterase-like protein
MAEHDPLQTTPSGKPRARSLGIPFAGTTGPMNAITDVPGCEVGYLTIVEGDSVRTGATAILPRGKAEVGDPAAAGFHALNGNGEMTGVSWIRESGTMAGPVVLTNTHAIGPAHAGVIAWTVDTAPALADSWLLPVVAETWDGYLNDINGNHVTVENVVAAIESSDPGPIEEGSVGGGTGMCTYGYKGGSGTASRLVPIGGRDYVVGVFVQANFGSRRELTVAGVPVGQHLGDDDPMADFFGRPPGAGSVIAIVLTDVPLLPHQCEALSRRVTLGLGRTGTTGSHFSGDLFLCVSTANRDAFASGAASLVGLRSDDLSELRFVQWSGIDPIYAAVVQATEEAVLNALVANDSMIGMQGHRVPALPHDRLRTLLGQRAAPGDVDSQDQM